MEPNATCEPAAGAAAHHAGPFLGRDLPELLRLVIRAELCEGRPSASRVARLAGLSLRDMQRRLAGAEISFSELLREAVIERATELLREPHLRVTDIGLEVGYAESANFTRAFRRWTGLSPRAYRRRLMPAGTNEETAMELKGEPYAPYSPDHRASPDPGCARPGRGARAAAGRAA
jgi:AraC-like DNA-binding protein